MIQLREGTMGADKAGCHVLEMTGATGTLAETERKLSEVADKLSESDVYWGGENNAVVILVDKDTEPAATGMAIGTISRHDEYPFAVVLIAGEHDRHAVCIYAGESEMCIGEEIVYEAGDAWAPTADADPDEPAEARA